MPGCHPRRLTDFNKSDQGPGESGIAVLLALMGLSLFSLLGLYLALNATTEVRISDNYESQLAARSAAEAGVNHARFLIRGLTLNALLVGPDGRHDESAAYLVQSKKHAFRSLFSWTAARSLDILDPSDGVAGLPDDGLINTGYYEGVDGIVLLPLSGRAQVIPNPYGVGSLTGSRYFVKVSDNNGESSELAGDPCDDPFRDGDGEVIVRSMGIARAERETFAGLIRQNSVVVLETRLRRRSTFDLGSPLVVEGASVTSSFTGNAFVISGGDGPGVSTIDLDSTDSLQLDQRIRSAALGQGSITGGGLAAPSVQDITGQIASKPDQSLLFNPNYLWDFVNGKVPKFADQVFDGDQDWTGANAPDIGSFDKGQPINAPGQEPKVTLVRGNLVVDGGFAGGGLLVIGGNFSCNGTFAYTGLVLVVGSGNFEATDITPGINGGVFVVRVTKSGSVTGFGTPSISINGESHIIADRNAILMAIGLIPPSEISFREVTSNLDP